MALLFYTIASAKDIAETVGEALKSIPNTPDHFFPEFDIDEPVPIPESGDIAIVMGTYAMQQLAKVGVVPKGRTITYLRGKVWTHPEAVPHADGPYMFSYDPGSKNSDVEKIYQILWDVQLASRLHNTGSLLPEIGDYKYVEDLGNFLEKAEAQFHATGKTVNIGADLETMGLVPWDKSKKIVSLSVSMKEGTGECCYLLRKWKPGEWKKFISQVETLLTAPWIKIWGANFKFDLHWVKEKWGLDCTNFSMDTLIVGSLLNENISNSLNHHAKLMTTMGGYDDAFNDKYDKAHMELIPKKQDYLNYAAGDADATLRCGNVLKERLLKDSRLTSFYLNVLHPAARAFEKVEANGLYLDVDKHFALGDQLEQHIEELSEKALALIPVFIRVKHAKKGIKLSRPSLIGDYFFNSPRGLNLKPIMLTPQTGVPSTAWDHLKMFVDHPDAKKFLDLYKQHSSATKTLSTYIKGFYKHLREDGKFHPSYFMYAGRFEDKKDEGGTVTGRLSAKDPAVQTIPKHTIWATAIRECYPAPPGYMFWQADYSQGELRIIACVANEEQMIAAYKAGIDLHCLTAAGVNGYTLEDFMALEKVNKQLFKAYRQGAKAGNFGLSYGMSAKGYQAYAFYTYGVIISITEAEEQRDKFFETYPGLVGWHNLSIAEAHRDLQIVSPLGRIRHLPLIRSRDNSIRSYAERQAINSPIQATLSDMNLWTTALFHEQYQTDQCLIVGSTHDSIYGYVDKNMVQDWMLRIKDIMENLPFEKVGWKPQLPFPVDFEIGTNMGNLEPLDLAA